jgi:hypothetical protein
MPRQVCLGASRRPDWCSLLASAADSLAAKGIGFRRNTIPYVKIVPFWRARLAVALVVASAALAAACTHPATSAPRPALSASRPARSPAPGRAHATFPRRDPAGTVWLCRPGLAGDPCAGALRAAAEAADGLRTIEPAIASRISRFDCFYVYPTVSTEPGLNSDLTVQPAEVNVAIDQAAPFSQVCDVWAPMYRQITVDGLGKAYIDPAPGKIAYLSLLSAWNDFITHYDNGRPIIFIGHSQGSSMLIRLLQAEVDPKRALRHRTVVAILAGGNVTVPIGREEGATFRHLPLCTSPRQIGCVIAYSSFPAEPPANADFGRPGQGVSVYSGQTATTGVEVACVNPASLGGGSADLLPYFPVARVSAVGTSWVIYPRMYSASCQSRGGATWLEVRKIASGLDIRPHLTEALGPAWGYHLVDINLALGNLIADVRGEESAYQAQH